MFCCCENGFGYLAIYYPNPFEIYFLTSLKRYFGLAQINTLNLVRMYHLTEKYQFYLAYLEMKDK